MIMGRKAFITTTTIGLSSLVAGCAPQFGGGGGGRRTEQVPGPDSAQEVMSAARLADAPDGAQPELITRTPPTGCEWAREVRFSAPPDAVDEWLSASFGSVDAAAQVHVLKPSVADAFDVTDVPDTWRSLERSVDGTPLTLMLLIDDADPETVRIHLREQSD